MKAAPPPSLQLRLGLGLFISLTSLFGLLWMLADISVRSLAEERVGDRLRHDADSIVAALQFDAGDRPILHEDHLGPYFHRPFSGHYYVVETPRDLYRSRSLWDVDLGPFPGDHDPGDAHRLRRDGPQGQPLLVLATTFHKQAQRVRLMVAEDMSRLEEELARFRWRLGVVFTLVLSLLVGLQWLLLRLGLAPLERHRRLLEQLKQGEIQTLPEDAPRELLPLVREINHLLESLRERLERSRHALGNLAHALKTPLAILQRTLEQPGLDPITAHPLLMEQTARIRDLTERELRRARLAGKSGRQGRMDPVAEIRELLPVLERIHGEKPLALRLHAPAELPYTGDREDFLELAGNLLDNACQWAREEVAIHLSLNGEGLRLQVEDDGPGVAEEELARLRRDGVRVDERAAGHGLGLAIVGDVVKHYGGTLTFDRSPTLGGLRVRVTLPP